MNASFDDVQRIVLRGGVEAGSDRSAPPVPWRCAVHMVLGFGQPGASPLRFLKDLQKAGDVWPTRTGDSAGTLQASLGFSRRGLEHAHVPDHVLSCLALKAPAFHAGAAIRSALHGAATGVNGPRHWLPWYSFTDLDAVLSLHGVDSPVVEAAVAKVKRIGEGSGVAVTELAPHAKSLPTPRGEKDVANAQWVHFGYRDGLSRVPIEGWSAPIGSKERGKASLPGEFLLGYRQDSGENPWIAGPGTHVWPGEVRRFFRNGSFGVLQQIEQHVGKFEDFVTQAARDTGLAVEEIKAKLCGRFPDGRPLADATLSPEEDFDYTDDPTGLGCPFGSHVRRMNPRETTVVHGSRSRRLIRRGMPYGPAWQDQPDGEERGLFGHFFCASIEDQFEHLVAMWGDRMPMGSADRGGARDPLFGAHEPNDGRFEVPVGVGQSLALPKLPAFTRVRGTAYLLYPGLETLARIADNALWIDFGEEEF